MMTAHATQSSSARALATAVSGDGDDARRRDVLARVTDPEAVWALALEEDLGAMLAWRIEELGLLDGEPWRRMGQTMGRLVAAAQAGADWRRRCVAHVFAALAADGILPVPIKGIWLAEHGYPQPWCRNMVDADVLVGADARRVLDLLGARDIRPNHDDQAILEHAFLEGDELSVRAPWKGAVYVDLHFRLYPDLPLGAAAEVAAHAEPGSCAGVEVRGPALTDHLLIVAHHLIFGTTHAAWRTWLDVDVLARAISDWDVVVSRSIAWRNPALLLVALAGARQLFDTPVPAGAVNALLAALTPGERPVVASALARDAWLVDRDALLLCQWRERRAGWRSRSVMGLLWPHPGFVARQTGVSSTAPDFWKHRVRFAAGRLARGVRAAIHARLG